MVTNSGSHLSKAPKIRKVVFPFMNVIHSKKLFLDQIIEINVFCEPPPISVKKEGMCMLIRLKQSNCRLTLLKRNFCPLENVRKLSIN